MPKEDIPRLDTHRVCQTCLTAYKIGTVHLCSSKEISQVDAMELRAALGIMLLTWGNASEKLTAFLKYNNKETAEAYAKVMPLLFDAAILARAIYEKSKPV